MKEIFELLNTYAENLPEWLKFLSFWVVLCGVVFYKKVEYKDIVSIFSKAKAKTEAKKRLLEKIINHSILRSKEKYFCVINNYSFGNEDLNILFKSLLKIKIKTVISSIENFIKENKDKELERSEVIKKINCLTNEMNTEHERIFLVDITEILVDNSKILKADGDTIKCIPFYAKQLQQIIIDGFNQYNSKNVSWIFGFIENLGETEIFDDNEEAVKQYLDSVKFALKLSIFDAEKAFKNFNGNLSSKLDMLRKLKLWN